MIIYTDDFFSLSSTHSNEELVRLVDSNTLENVNFKKVNGNAIPANIDGIIYRCREISNDVYVNTIIFSGENINIKTFGVKADGVTDDSIAFQEAINTSLSLGIPLTLPNGLIWLRQTININLALIKPGKAFEIHGKGIDNTILGADTQDIVLDIIGHDNLFNLKVTNFTVKRYPGNPSGVGIKISKAVFLSLEDIFVTNFNYGLILYDCVSGFFKRLRFTGNNYGVLGNMVGNFTNPNLLNFINCIFSENLEVACQMVNVHNVKFDTCAFEFNQKGIDFSFNGDNGRNSTNIINSYFEGNNNFDIYLYLKSNGSHNLYGCIFNRSVESNMHPIIIENSIEDYTQVINFLGNAFKNSGDFSIINNTPPIKIYGNNFNVIDSNMYEKPNNYPNYTGINVIKLL